MPEADEVSAIRTRVGLHRGTPVGVALRGEGAREAALRLCPSRLFLRDAMIRESLLLDEAGRPLADVLVAADDEDYLLLAEGLDAAGLRAVVDARLEGSRDVSVEDLGAGRAMISLDGPWAWSAVAAVLGPDLVALPYLNLFRVDAGLCLRVGKTGEFGYQLLVDEGAAEGLYGALEDAVAGHEGRAVGDQARALCRFEGWFFDPAHIPTGVTPIELGLGWRLDLERDWLGRAAIEERLAAPGRRLRCLLAPRPITMGEPVRLRGEEVGVVVRAAYSWTRGEHVIAALIDEPVGHGGVDFEVEDAAGATTRARLVAPPLLDNHSLHVDPRRHTFTARDEVALGPLARGPRAPEAA